MDRVNHHSILSYLCLFFLLVSCFIYSARKGISDSSINTQQLNKYENLLIQTIENLNKKDFSRAKETFEKLKSELDETSSNKAFPSLSTFFRYPITHIINTIQKEISLPYLELNNVNIISLIPWWFSSSNEFLKSNFIIFEELMKNFQSFSFLPDFYWDLAFKRVSEKRIILNLSDSDQIIQSDNFSFVINLLPPTKGKSGQIYLLPNIRYIFQALLTFIKDNFGCSPAVLYPEEKEEQIKDLKELSWLLGVTISVIIKYKGIDITPYLKTKSYEMSPPEIKKKYKPSEIQKINTPEIYSTISDVLQKSECLIVLDNPKNSAAIIPQIRFIGAKDIIFFGIGWGKLKTFLEKRFYGSVYYADILPANVDTTEFLISEIRKIADFLLSVEPTELANFERIGIKINPQTLIITPEGVVLRSVFIWKVGETIEKVAEIIQDEIL